MKMLFVPIALLVSGSALAAETAGAQPGPFPVNINFRMFMSTDVDCVIVGNGAFSSNHAPIENQFDFTQVTYGFNGALGNGFSYFNVNTSETYVTAHMDFDCSDIAGGSTLVDIDAVATVNALITNSSVFGTPFDTHANIAADLILPTPVLPVDIDGVSLPLGRVTAGTPEEAAFGFIIPSNYDTSGGGVNDADVTFTLTAA